VKVSVELENPVNAYPVHPPALTLDDVKQNAAERRAKKTAGK